MKLNFSEQVLMFLAAWADYNRRSFSIHLALAMDGDPRLDKNRRKMMNCIKNKKNRKKFLDTLYALKKGNFITKNSTGYILSPKGKIEIIKLNSPNIKKKKLPAKQYLMVFFDIPESKKKIRDLFRNLLKTLGYEKIQRSIWISSYDTRKEVEEIIDNYGLSENVKILLVKEF